jgi:hypothetical protein
MTLINFDSLRQADVVLAAKRRGRPLNLFSDVVKSLDVEVFE